MVSYGEGFRIFRVWIDTFRKIALMSFFGKEKLTIERNEQLGESLGEKNQRLKKNVMLFVHKLSIRIKLSICI